MGAKRPDQRLDPTKPFSLLPDAVFGEESDWTPMAWGRWTYADHVTLGESRVIVLLAELLLGDVRAHRSKVLCLEDNLPTAGAMNKGRSCSAPLNYLCRKRAACSLAGNIKIWLPWVETKRMPADSLSRWQGFE